MVSLATPADAPRWDAFVDAHPASHHYHRSAWTRIIETAFGHEPCSLLAETDGAITGVLPLIRLRSRLFGHFLVSLPFVNYGGPCSQGDEPARALVAEAVRLARSWNVDHLELRTETPLDCGLATRSSKVSMRLRLPATSDELWKRFTAKLRNQVKRAQQEAMTVRIGRLDEVEAFYEVFATNMRDLGTPVYSRRFFETVLRELPDSSWICTVSLGTRPVAAGLLVGFRDAVEIPWASSLREFNRLSPNMLLYWSVLKFACERQYSVFDFGRSSPDSGPYRFKAQWGATPTPLSWQYYVKDDKPLPELNPQNPKYRLAIRVWQRLPVSVTRLVGPSIVRNIP